VWFQMLETVFLLPYYWITYKQITTCYFQSLHGHTCTRLQYSNCECTLGLSDPSGLTDDDNAVSSRQSVASVIGVLMGIVASTLGYCALMSRCSHFSGNFSPGATPPSGRISPTKPQNPQNPKMVKGPFQPYTSSQSDSQRSNIYRTGFNDRTSARADTSPYRSSLTDW
jgi:hypothetical protein